MTENPYESPQADVSREAESNKDAAPPAEEKPVKWRVFTSVGFWLIGGVWVGLSIYLFFALWGLARAKADVLVVIAGSFSFLCLGIAFCVAGLMTWRRRGQVAIFLALLIAFACQATVFGALKIYQYITTG